MTEFSFLLFVTSKENSKSIKAVKNLDRICKGHKFNLTILDLSENPKIAKSLGIIATPFLIKYLPKPSKKIVGDLSNLKINSLMKRNSNI